MWLNNISVDLTAIGIMVLLVVSRILTPKETIGGFANPAVITVAAMFIVSKGMMRTGGISYPGFLRIHTCRNLYLDWHLNEYHHKWSQYQLWFWWPYHVWAGKTGGAPCYSRYNLSIFCCSWNFTIPGESDLSAQRQWTSAISGRAESSQKKVISSEKVPVTSSRTSIPA